MNLVKKATLMTVKKILQIKLIVQNLIYDAADLRIDQLADQVARYKRYRLMPRDSSQAFALVDFDMAFERLTHLGAGRPTLFGAVKRYLGSHAIIHRHMSALHEMETEVSTHELLSAMFSPHSSMRPR